MNQNSFKWNKFRLSWSIMNSTLSHSTHFRATCNFNTDGLVTTDYLRAKTIDLNILQVDSYPCVKMEYINIRGCDCYNRTAKMIEGINWHLHIDSSLKSCQFTSGGLENSKFLYQTRQTPFTKHKHRTHNLQTQRFNGVHSKKTQGYPQQPFWYTKK